ncbi:hypothetical protein MHBO_002395 [Bonamia ostreae]|uniref:Uncharacterized protein n=1 Tax=Bonamia ostreae TaxID=126728 RepID=A0ABV2AM48_9EUKA
MRKSKNNRKLKLHRNLFHFVKTKDCKVHMKKETWKNIHLGCTLDSDERVPGFCDITAAKDYVLYDLASSKVIGKNTTFFCGLEMSGKEVYQTIFGL